MLHLFGGPVTGHITEDNRQIEPMTSLLQGLRSVTVVLPMPIQTTVKITTLR